MKYTILGFSQKKLIEYNMDAIDALILRYFIDFKDTGEMVTRIIDDDIYYWIKYSSLLTEIQIIQIKSKDVLRRRLKNLVNNKILKFKCIRENGKGTFSFYTTGVNYKNLISFSDTTQKSDGSYSKVGGGPTQKSDGSYSKVGAKDSSIKDSSIKDIKDIIDYLNSKIGTSYKYTTKKTKELINARLKEGFTVEDFYTVIDKKSKDWLKTEYEKFLRPQTLFSNNFEGYLNQIETKKSNKEISNSSFKYLD